MGAEVFGGADALPVGGGLRRLPTEIAYGWGGEGDAFEGADLGVVGEGAFDYSFVGLYLERTGGVSSSCEEREC
jgi:hypothetical protein